MQYLIMATNYNGGSIYVVNPQQQSKKKSNKKLIPPTKIWWETEKSRESELAI